MLGPRDVVIVCDQQHAFTDVNDKAEPSMRTAVVLSTTPFPDSDRLLQLCWYYMAIYEFAVMITGLARLGMMIE